MRSGIVLGGLGLGALALLALILLPSRVVRTSGAKPEAPAIAEEPGTSEAPAPERADLASQTQPPQAQRPAIEPSQPELEKSSTSEKSAIDAQHEASVEARIAELRELSEKKDRVSLKILLSELKNPEPEIRQAVLDAITESKNRDAIPGLLEAAAQTEDPAEKKLIVEAVEYLKLPTLTETLRGQNR